MAASEAAVTAVMETLGCERHWAHPIDAPEPRFSLCHMHDEDWTDRGCPVAVAAADAVWPIAQAETLREAARAYGSGQLTGLFTNRDQYTKVWLSKRADRIEVQP